MEEVGDSRTGCGRRYVNCSEIQRWLSQPDTREFSKVHSGWEAHAATRLSKLGIHRLDGHTNLFAELALVSAGETVTWYLLAENDRMISPHTQRFMAERINAHIHSLPVDHSPLASAPDSVVKLIVAAIDGTRKSALPTDAKEGQ